MRVCHFRVLIDTIQCCQYLYDLGRCLVDCKLGGDQAQAQAQNVVAPIGNDKVPYTRRVRNAVLQLLY